MTTNIHVTFSDYIQGVGLFSGGPFGIYAKDEDAYRKFKSQGSNLNQNYDCNLNMYWQEQAARTSGQTKMFLQVAEEYELNGLIENTTNLAGQPVYIFSPTDDRVVPPVFQYS